MGERDLLHELSPGVPVTTNLMVMDSTQDMDYLDWGPELDIVSNDHYKTTADPTSYRELGFSSDLVRGVSGNRPWILMEQSTSAVNWQPHNVAKRPGELLRDSMQHVARGADGVLFFQWRASRAGAEKYHSGLVPHAGTDSRLWREVVGLGAALEAISEVAGSCSDNRAAVLFDWNARWASELDSHPSADLRYTDRVHAFHHALTDRGVGVDVVHPSADLSAYDLIVVPTLYLCDDHVAPALAAAARRGASVLVTYSSGIVDVHDHVRLGGYPGAFRDLLGVRCEEFLPLAPGRTTRLDDDTTADLWAEHLHLTGATAVARHLDGPAAGLPAVTRRSLGDGAAWYVATRTDDAGTAALVDALLTESGVAPVAATSPGVEVVRRRAEDGRSWVFVINHTDHDAVVPVHGLDLLSGAATGADGLPVRAGAVAVVREA